MKLRHPNRVNKPAFPKAPAAPLPGGPSRRARRPVQRRIDASLVDDPPLTPVERWAEPWEDAYYTFGDDLEPGSDFPALSRLKRGLTLRDLVRLAP